MSIERILLIPNKVEKTGGNTSVDMERLNILKKGNLLENKSSLKSVI